MSELATPDDESEEVRRTKGSLYSVYAWGIPIGLLFVIANLVPVACTIAREHWAWLLVCVLLSILHLVSPLLSYKLSRAYGKPGFTNGVLIEFAILLPPMLWFANLLLMYSYMENYPFWVN